MALHHAHRESVACVLALLAAAACKDPQTAPAVAPPAASPATTLAAPTTARQSSSTFAALAREVARKGKARIILVGDTGYPGAHQRAVSRAIRAESKDFIVALGDLIYPVAPKCPDAKIVGFPKLMMEERFHEVLSSYGAPVYLVLGNHDVGHVARDPGREACYFAYAKRHPNLYYLPALSYSVDLGFAHLLFANTNDLTREDGARFSSEWANHKGWRIGFGHHHWRVYHDKRGEDRVRPWARRHGLRPHLWGNGHAHLLQFVLDEGVWAVTSGTGALTRQRPKCPGSCGAGQTFGSSRPGYAVLELDAHKMTVTFKDFEGQILYERSRPRHKPAQ